MRGTMAQSEKFTEKINQICQTCYLELEQSVKRIK